MYAKDYYEYLKGRSSHSVLYKKIMVYPRVMSKTKGKILDYGCGIGDLISYNPDIIGVDINEYCINHCKEQGFDAYTIKENRLPFDDNKFTTIILDNVFEHLPYPEEQFSEIKRVMTDNATLIIGVPGLKGHSMDDTHIRYYDENLLIESLNKLGFDHQSFFYTPFVKSSHLSKKLSIYVLWGVFSART